MRKCESHSFIGDFETGECVVLSGGVITREIFTGVVADFCIEESLDPFEAFLRDTGMESTEVSEVYEMRRGEFDNYFAFD
jgi:hypothetical protein